MREASVIVDGGLSVLKRIDEHFHVGHVVGRCPPRRVLWANTTLLADWFPLAS